MKKEKIDLFKWYYKFRTNRNISFCEEDSLFLLIDNEDLVARISGKK